MNIINSLNNLISIIQERISFWIVRRINISVSLAILSILSACAPYRDNAAVVQQNISYQCQSVATSRTDQLIQARLEAIKHPDDGKIGACVVGGMLGFLIFDSAEAAELGCKAGSYMTPEAPTEPLTDGEIQNIYNYQYGNCYNYEYGQYSCQMQQQAYGRGPYVRFTVRRY